MTDFLEKAYSYLISLCVPVVISMISILFLLSSIFMNLEYRRPGFPPDSYGFTTEERLLFGNQTRQYLITNMTLDDLRDLEFDNGDPIYIDRELKHLEDVKIVLNGVLKVFWISVGILVLSAGYAKNQNRWQFFRTALSRGGWLTTAILGFILVLSLTSFQSLFTNFHLIFFEGNSWLFYYSDTLIRLFPIQFWQDVFLVFGLVTLSGGVLMGWRLGGKRKQDK